MTLFIFREAPVPEKKERLSKQDIVMLRNRLDNDLYIAILKRIDQLDKWSQKKVRELSYSPAMTARNNF